MKREEAIKILTAKKNVVRQKENSEATIEALEKAIESMQMLEHLIDRPCTACEFKKANGCSKWSCVFGK